MIPVGLQLYTVRDVAEGDPERVLEAVAAMGYEGVELAGLYGRTAPEVTELLSGCGLKIAGAHIALERLEADLQTVVAEAGALGLEDIIVPFLKEERRKDASGWLEVAGGLGRIGGALRGEGVKLSYHNHAFEFDPVGGSDRCGLDLLIENTDPAKVSFEVDTYWVRFGGRDPAELIRRLSGRIRILHAKDGLLGKEPHFTPVGEGELDWPPIFEACDGAGVGWLVVEQDRCEGSSLEAARRSFENLQKLNRAGRGGAL